VLGGADEPSPGLLLLVGSLAMALGVASSGSRLGRARVVAIVVAGQLLLHELFMMLVAVDSAADPWGLRAMPGMPGMTVPVAPGGAPSGAAWSMLADHAVASVTSAAGATMLVAHALAAVLVGLWLAAGERLVWSVLELLRARWRSAAMLSLVRAVGALVRDSVAAHDARPSAMVGRLAPPWRPSTWFLVRATSRRGPPVPDAVALS
jgi:hypothetical protein